MGRSRSSAHRLHSLRVVCRTPKAKYSVAGWQEEQLLCDDIAEVRNGNRILYVTTADTTARGKLISSQQVCAAWASEPASNRCLGMCSTAASLLGSNEQTLSSAVLAGVREGQQVVFSVPAYPGQMLHAPIARISHNIDQNTRTMAVEIDVRNAKITAGTFANVQWPVQRTYPTLFVPATAITTNLQRTFVIRIRDGKAEWVDVKTGVSANGKVEIFGKLQAEDQVAANASDDLVPGTPVKARQHGVNDVDASTV